MRQRNLRLHLAAAVLISTLVLLPAVSFGQSARITVPKNKYSIQDDIKLGQQAAGEIEKQFPLIRDAAASAYIERVGQRLVSAVPPELQQPAFHYRFQWVNASDINAFALPGGPMYINRGMIESARTEGEMAGVMAHELSHVILRHATAQATKNSSAGSTLRNLGLILGGAVAGGQAGAELGGVFAQSFMLKYSREYESQADLLGAIIMANAGYDPHDLANVFKTIEQQSRGSAPQWLSDHPNPGNRYDAINKEAETLRIAERPITTTPDFLRTQERFRSMPRAQSMAEIERGAQRGGNGQRGYGRGNGYPNSPGGHYSDRVAAPSSEMRNFSDLDSVSMSVPINWRESQTQEGVEFAPDGAVGNEGITRGIMIGRYRVRSEDLQTASQDYFDHLLQENPYLRPQGRFSPVSLAGRRGYTISASGTSPVTGRTEVVSVYTTQMRNGEIFYAVTVVPSSEQYAYNGTFRDIIRSIHLNN